MKCATKQPPTLKELRNSGSIVRFRWRCTYVVEKVDHGEMTDLDKARKIVTQRWMSQPEALKENIAKAVAMGSV